MSTGFDIVLPKSWAWSPLKFSTTFLNRGTSPDYVDDGSVRAISQAANQSAGLDWERTRFHDYNGDPRRLKGYLVPGDVLINSTGTGTLGRVGYFMAGPDDVPCVADGHVTVARADRNVAEARYMYYWLTSTPFHDYIYSALIVGATNQIELNRERLAGAPIALPSLHEQRRIANFLDAETAQIGRLQHARDRQLVALAELASSIVSAVIPRKSEVAFVRLGYIATIQSGITVDASRDFGADAVTLPYLRVANVQNGHVDLDSVSEITIPRPAARSAMLKRGDVLMTEGGDLDKLGRGTVWLDEIKSCLHQNHVFAVRPVQRKLVPEYLALLTRTAYARSYFESTGTKTTNLASTNSRKIRDFKIPLLDVEDQGRVFRNIDARLKDIGRLEAAISQQRCLLAERRQALITAAVTGRIDVSTARGLASAGGTAI